MRDLIRHILKENRLQQELKQVIEDNGIFDAIYMVGGLNNLKSIFKDEPEFSEILDELTGVVDFSYYEKYFDKNPILFPFKYEIVGIKKNTWNTNSWPLLNLIYDEDKLSPSENETLKSIIAVIQNDNTTGKIKTKTLNFKDSNYFDVTQINGKDVELHEDEFPFSKEDVKRIHNKLYGESESLNESANRETDKKLKLVKEMIYSLFDEVEFVEVDTNYEGKPLIKIYHDVEDTAANYDSWIARQIQNTIEEMTGGSVILSPYWAPNWDVNKKNADFYIDVEKIEYDNEGNVISESENKQERKFNKLVQKIEDYLNSNEYPSVKKFTVYYEDTHDDVIVNIFFDPVESVKLGGGINSVIKRVGKQVMEDLEVFPMEFKYYIHFDRDINESTEKKSKYLNIIEDLVEPFKDEVGVCDINVSYDDDDDMYSVYIVMSTEEMNDKFFYVPMIQSHISKLRINVKTTIKDYLPIDNLYVGSYGKPNCNWNPLNESSIKQKSLIKLLEKDGLYDFIEMTGLDFNQVRSLLKHIDNPKEILKQYIRQFVIEDDPNSGENSGVLIGVEIPLSNTKYVNDIMVQDSDQIAVEIFEFGQDEYGHTEQKDQYLTTINILTNEELLSILSWMMETIQNGYRD